MNLLETFPYAIPAVLIAIVMHEWAHGFVSYKLGDPSAKAEGRLSLNPLKHLDPMGTLCLLVFHFGWAKPVQVNPNYYKDPKMGMVLTALAGPVMNFIIAFVAVGLFQLVVLQDVFSLPYDVLAYFFSFFSYLAVMNVGLGVFNLIPIPPLDGSKALLSFLPEKLYFQYMRYEQIGMIILIILLATGVLSPLMSGVVENLILGMEKVIRLII